MTCALAGCGGGSSADPLLKAADATASQTGEKVRFQGRIDLSGQVTTVTGGGAFADSSGELHLLFDTDGLGSSKLDEIFRDGVIWLRSPVLATSVYGKHWLKLDHGERASFLGFDLSAVTEQTPTAALDKLRRRGTVEVLGTESVGGVETTHYRKALTPSGTDIVYNAAEAWVDEGGLVRQVKLDLTARIHPPSEERARIRLKLIFTDFGTRVDVKLPPPSDVLDSNYAKSG